MKKVLGIDLGTNSIGWALVNEASEKGETSEIIKLGVRVNPLTVDEKTNFEKGRPLSTNADRTLKRGARRNLQRYKLRRDNLIEILVKNGLISKDSPLTEIGKETTHQTLKLRAKSAKEKISLEDFSKILLTINKKRGYKSSRKVNNDEDGQAIDGMAVAKKLYEGNLTPGQYVLNLLEKNRKYIPDFYRSDLQEEFKKVWKTQKAFYPQILTDKLYEELQDKNKTQTWAICKEPFTIVGIKQSGTATEKRLERYQWRTEGLSKKLELEHLAIVLQEINNDLKNSSGYLGAISDRSKALYFNKETVGENLYKQILKSPHTSLKNQVFYRQDYLDEFESIWETQAKFHPELTDTLKEEIRDVVIFFQRKLKSQKGLISFCQFENWEQTYTEKETGKEKTRTIGRKVIPKSSPLFQEFKIWQNLNHLEFTNSEKKEIIEFIKLDDDIKQLIFEELNLRGNLNPNDILKILGDFLPVGKVSQWKCNFEEVEGNRTNAALYNVYQIIAENEGYGFDWAKKTASEIKEELKNVFPQLGIDPSILDFDFHQDNFDKQTSYQLWHLLYSAEEDFKISEEDKLVYGNSAISLKKQLHQKYGFKPEYTKMLANISLQPDYGNLSAKAIRKILPELEDGYEYSEACEKVGYNHSNSLTAEEKAKRALKPKLELLKKNSLRNPVVEKILNQMVNVVNQVIETYGKPDEIRIELARELKKSAKERADMTKSIADATKRNDDNRKTIIKEFGIPNPTKSDIVRYRLWQELASRGHKDIFTNIEIKPQDLFSNKIDIEHIIPKALLFDDSFSNKTLAFKKDNLQKGKRTAYDFIANDYAHDLENYNERVESLFKDGKITRAKRNKLLMPKNKLPDDFIERDLRNSQYIAIKAKQMLFEVFRTVVSTSGSITDKLREDWDLINVMKELNFPKYKALGLTEKIERYDVGAEKIKEIEVIKDWNKRNDHRHHAMDALTVAFTTHNHIQYLNNLNTFHDLRKNETDIEKSNLYKLKNTITKTYERENGKKKRKFIPPMESFRTYAKEHIESILVSFKNKNKVVTKNINKTKCKGKDKFNTKIQLTPRGQLHKETVYGKYKYYQNKEEKVNAKFDLETIGKVSNPIHKKALLQRLSENENNPKKAFAGKNSLSKNPIYLNDDKTEVLPEKVNLTWLEEGFSIRKDVTPDLKIDKIIDEGVKRILQKRLDEFGGKAKEAFSDIEKNPIWLNKPKSPDQWENQKKAKPHEKGIAIKRVTITGVSNAESLHHQKDHLGNVILDKDEKPIPTDFVSTGNNHHVAVYRDEKGNLQENVVSFFEAVERVNQKLPVIDKSFNQHLGWQFLFTMKQNEMFVFPNEETGFNPNEIDLLDPNNKKEISPNLFRVQKFSKLIYGNSAVREYVFRHHLETELKDDKVLQGITFHQIKSLSPLKDIIKVRTNHLGDIVQIGEY